MRDVDYVIVFIRLIITKEYQERQQRRGGKSNLVRMNCNNHANDYTNSLQSRAILQDCVLTIDSMDKCNQIHLVSG